jgi:holo-[acyl-carrier protein] synthase
MTIIGHGVDTVSVARLEHAMTRSQDGHFEARVFGESERAYCKKKSSPYPHFAARFAAKEAYAKALGLGIGPAGDLVEIEVVNLTNGAPSIELHGRAAEIFRQHGGEKILVSLSHDGDMALASVIILGKDT